MKRIISVTDAARNFADCINRAHYQNVTFVLLKSGSPLAHCSRYRKSVHGADLAFAVAETKLSSGGRPAARNLDAMPEDEKSRSLIQPCGELNEVLLRDLAEYLD